MVTAPDADEVHPSELVTVYVYVLFGVIPDTIVLVPLPEVVVPPGVRINVHEPVEGNPLNITLPVETEHVG